MPSKWRHLPGAAPFVLAHLPSVPFCQGRWTFSASLTSSPYSPAVPLFQAIHQCVSPLLAFIYLSVFVFPHALNLIRWERMREIIFCGLSLQIWISPPTHHALGISLLWKGQALELDRLRFGSWYCYLQRMWLWVPYLNSTILFIICK